MIFLKKIYYPIIFYQKKYKKSNKGFFNCAVNSCARLTFKKKFVIIYIE